MKKMVLDYVALEERGWKVAFFLLPAAGVALIALGWMRAKATAAREGWPQVSAVVIESRVDELKDGGASRYAPHIAYRYFLDDKKHEGSRLGSDAAQFRFTSKARAEELALAHPVAKEIKVRVNPDNPDDSQLFDAADHGGGLRIGIGVALLAIFIMTEIYWHTGHEAPDTDFHIGDIPATPAEKT